MTTGFRVGVGYDIHRLVEGRRLMLGGVEIPHVRGLLGHTDADVALHAITDALLGAAGLPDIGDLFPDTDAAFRGADSRNLLAEVVRKVRDRGFDIGNVDIIVHAEEPKLSPHKSRMVESIAGVLQCSTDKVSVKAKTNEGLGPIGQADAIACTAVALLAEAVTTTRR